MLETIKSCIQNLPNNSFDQYFQEYVMKVQDLDIQNEIDLTLLYKHLDIKGLSKQIDSCHKEFANYGKFK